MSMIKNWLRALIGRPPVGAPPAIQTDASQQGAQPSRPRPPAFEYCPLAPEGFWRTMIALRREYREEPFLTWLRNELGWSEELEKKGRGMPGTIYLCLQLFHRFGETAVIASFWRALVLYTAVSIQQRALFWVPIKFGVVMMILWLLFLAALYKWRNQPGPRLFEQRSRPQPLEAFHRARLTLGTTGFNTMQGFYWLHLVDSPYINRFLVLSGLVNVFNVGFELQLEKRNQLFRRRAYRQAFADLMTDGWIESSPYALVRMLLTLVRELHELQSITQEEASEHAYTIPRVIIPSLQRLQYGDHLLAGLMRSTGVTGTIVPIGLPAEEIRYYFQEGEILRGAVERLWMRLGSAIITRQPEVATALLGLLNAERQAEMANQSFTAAQQQFVTVFGQQQADAALATLAPSLAVIESLLRQGLTQNVLRTVQDALRLDVDHTRALVDFLSVKAQLEAARQNLNDVEAEVSILQGPIVFPATAPFVPADDDATGDTLPVFVPPPPVSPAAALDEETRSAVEVLLPRIRGHERAVSFLVDEGIPYEQAEAIVVDIEQQRQGPPVPPDALPEAPPA